MRKFCYSKLPTLYLLNIKYQIEQLHSYEFEIQSPVLYFSNLEKTSNISFKLY